MSAQKKFPITAGKAGNDDRAGDIAPKISKILAEENSSPGHGSKTTRC